VLKSVQREECVEKIQEVVIKSVCRGVHTGAYTECPVGAFL